MSKRKAQRDIYGSVAHFESDLRPLSGSTKSPQFSEKFAADAVDMLTELKALEIIRNGKLKCIAQLAEIYQREFNGGKDKFWLEKSVTLILPPNEKQVKGTNIRGAFGDHEGFQVELRAFELQRINQQRTKVIVLLEHAFGSTTTDFVIDNQTGKVEKHETSPITGLSRARGFHRWTTVFKRIAKACEERRRTFSI